MEPARRRDRLARARLYVVSDAREGQGDLAGFLDSVLRAGADVVQLREKEAEAGDILRWGAVFRDAADRHGALFVVNDRPDLATVLGADGVHVEVHDCPEKALSDGPQALLPDRFDALMKDVRRLAQAVGKTIG